ncbi:MAG: Gfo/Idh/MocA family oxidoreductase [Planctomycetota bacterium]
MKTSDSNKKHAPTRRRFLKTGTTVAAASAVAAPMVIPQNVHSAEPAPLDEIRIGLIGAGGRGTGAVSNNLNSNSNVKVVAIADLAEDRLETSRAAIMKSWADKGKADLPKSNCFIGIDAYQKVCEHKDVDLIIHTTPPGLRATTLRCAVENDKHSFVEKPVCVDAHTYHHCIESGEMAVKKKVAIVSGTQYRRETSYKAAIEELHNGVIGDVVGAFAYYCAGTLWLRGNPEKWKTWGGYQGMEYQMRNWLYFTWLSGDHIAEQAVHNIDAINWGLKSVPEKAYGSGGRLVRTDESYGDIYDHFSIDYDYPGNVRVSFKCRQMRGAKGFVSNRFVGTNGIMDIRPNPGRTATVARDRQGEILWTNNGRDNNAPYEQEHMDLVASIRNGKPIMEIQEVADSSMTALMGREAAYSGQEVTYDFMINKSTQKLGVDDLTAKEKAVRDVPKPGSYELS